MRHLVVPACLCLMTFAGSTGYEPKLAPEYLVSTLDKKFADALPAADTADNNNPRDTAPAETSQDIDAVTADILGLGDATQVVMPLTAPLPPIAKPVVERTREEICSTLTEAAQSNDLPVPFFIHLLFQESRFNAGEVSNAGAQGIAQFMPETATSVGLDNPFDPLEAIPASARLLRDLFHQFGNLGLAAAAYNAGPRRIQDWLAKKGKLPEETQGYVKIITGRPAENWSAAENGSPAMKLPRRAPCQEAAGLLAWDGPEQIPLPPTRDTGTSVASHGKAMLVARAHAKILPAQPQLETHAVKTTIVKAASVKPAVIKAAGVKAAVLKTASVNTAIVKDVKVKVVGVEKKAHAAKAGPDRKHSAVQLAAASKQKHQKVRVSAR